MNIVIDNSSGTVSWSHNGNSYCCNAENVVSAYEKNGVIFMDICSDGAFSYKAVDLCGNDILCYDDNGDLTLAGNTVLSFGKIADVTLSNGNILVMLSDKITVLSADGTAVSEIRPPSGYSFYRFSGDDGISVICCGIADTADKFGRSDRKFSYDPLGGCWSGGSVAY